jgi:hypothetical protein
MKSTIIGLLTLIVSLAYCFETIEYLLEQIEVQAMLAAEEVPIDEDDAGSESADSDPFDEFDGIHQHFPVSIQSATGLDIRNNLFLASLVHSSEVFSPPEIS